VCIVKDSKWEGYFGDFSLTKFGEGVWYGT
jgi:hypothetical protein